MIISRSNFYFGTFCLLFWFVLIYPSLKYFLGYGDLLTSGVYRDGIPLWYKLSDDVIVLLAITLLLCMSLRGGKQRRHGLEYLFIISAFAAVFSAALLRAPIGIVPIVKELLILSLFGLAVYLCPSKAEERIFTQFIPNFVHTAYWVVIGSFALQVFLFAAIGKPPILSWSSDFSRIFDGGIIRFGGIASSPNEASVLAIVLAILSDFKSRWVRFLKWVSLAVILILAKSGTGFILLVLFLTLRFPLVLIPVILIAATYLSFLPAINLDQSTVYHLQHLIAADSEWKLFAAKSSVIGKNETLVVFILDNIGLLFALLLFLAFLAAAVVAMLSICRGGARRRAGEAILSICTSCLVIPTVFYFPIGMIFLILLYQICVRDESS